MSFKAALGSVVQELRIQFCQQSAASAGTRYVPHLGGPWGQCAHDGWRGWVVLTRTIVPVPCSAYVAKNYPVLKKLNPSLPILIREAAGAEPRMIARYGSQRVECVHLFYSFEFVCLIASLPLPSSVLLGDRMLQTLASNGPSTWRR